MTIRRLCIKVKPNARTSSLETCADGSWRATLRAAPADGKANAELIALVAARFGCPKTRVHIRSGGAARSKWLEIDLPD